MERRFYRLNWVHLLALSLTKNQTNGRDRFISKRQILDPNPSMDHYTYLWALVPPYTSMITKKRHSG